VAEHSEATRTKRPAKRKYESDHPLWRDGFTSMPNVLMRDESVSGLAKILWLAINDFDYRGLEPELAEVGRLLGIGEKATRGYMRELEAAGWVKSHRRGLGLTNRYESTDPFGSIQNGQNDRSGTGDMADPERANGRIPTRARDSGEDERTKTRREAKNASRPRRPNLPFDALAKETRSDPVADGALLGRSLKTIRQRVASEAGGTAPCPDLVRERAALILIADDDPHANEPLADEIRTRARQYRSYYNDGIELTAPALAKNWTRVTQARGGTSGEAVDYSIYDKLS
jgi:hypothetical protein